jgi:hypothetical protein
MKLLIFVYTIILVVLGVLLIPGKSFVVEANKPQYERIKASWYGQESCVRKDCLMANGEVFREDDFTCASRKYYGKTLIIKYQDKKVSCEVKDKISRTYDDTRIDLSRGLFSRLDSLDKGILEIEFIIWE